MRALIYARVSTEEQDPEGQLQIIREYAKEKGYEIVDEIKEKISGTVDPLKRPKFRKLLERARSEGIGVILLYDLTRFYRAKSPTEALQKLREIMDKYHVFIDFAREPEIEDPLLKELWQFIKSWFSSYERLQISQRVKYGLLKAKEQGKLYHRPSILHYYTSWLHNKPLKDLTEEDLEGGRRQLIAIVRKYWDNPAFKRTKIGEVLAKNELREMYIRFPNAPRGYLTFKRLLDEEKL